MRREGRCRFWSWATPVIVATSGVIAPVHAQDADDQMRGVARISLVQGDVSIQRGDSSDWVAASVNAPIMTNDRISTGVNSRAEVQFDSVNFLRLGGGADVSMTQLDSGRYQMGVAHGTVTFRVLRSSKTDIEVDTPSVSVRPTKIGAYRIAVTEDGETEVTARSGEVEVFSPRGSQWVRSGQMLMARGAASDPEYQIVRSSPPDDWDRWNESRDQALTRSVSTQYVGPGIYGVEDLDPYGNWVNVPGYGYAWHPLVVEGWAPYRQGRWVWEDWYGWTWVSYEPWGWAPYHYGRWFYEPAYGWCWYPGLIGVRHYWAPALVAFFGFGGSGVSFEFGSVGWVPLAPYEVLHPWWGRGYYGSPTYINHSINITNVNITNVYKNARIQNGVTAVSGADFRSGRFNNAMRVSSDQLRSAGVVRGPMPIVPDRAHLQFSERQAAFIPRSIGNTRFFTREQPNPAPRISFAQQQRALVPVGRAVADQSAMANRGGLSGPAAARAVGDPAQRLRRQDVPGPAVNRGWSRFGEPGAAFRGEAPAARQELQNQPSFGGAVSAPRPELQNAPSFTEVNRRPAGREAQNQPSFGNTQAVQPPSRNQPAFGGGSRFGQPGRFESPRMAVPVVRERPSSGGFSAPRSAPGSGASAPRSGGGDRGNRGGGRNR